MRKYIKPLSSEPLLEGVNEDLVKSKADVNAKLAEIAAEIAVQKEAETTLNKIASIKKQATLYSQLPALLNKLASSMEAKEKSGDTTTIY